jgi:hypothetical protein
LRAWRSPRFRPAPARPGRLSRADVSDPKALIAALNTAFEEFKATHEQQLAAKVDDSLLEQKLRRSTRRCRTSKRR